MMLNLLINGFTINTWFNNGFDVATGKWLFAANLGLMVVKLFVDGFGGLGGNSDNGGGDAPKRYKCTDADTPD